MTADHSPSILVVEDDLHVVQGLIGGLKRNGFDITVAMDGLDAIEMGTNRSFDLIVLDLMLPERTGFEVLEALRGRTSTPIIVLTARTELDVRLGSFSRGAVDYVSKPFYIEELVARIQARLAVVDDGPRRVLTVGSLHVDLDARMVRRDQEDLGLTGKEFNVLAWLVERPNRAVSREQLASNVLGAEGARAHRTVDSHVCNVRKKIGAEGAFLRTVWGIGYRFDPENDG